MIRIDEIYNNTFWPWLERNRPGTRMFFCDPPGHTGVENLFNLGRDDIAEIDYIFFHDQEPVDLELYEKLFDTVANKGPAGLGFIADEANVYKKVCCMLDYPGHVIVSERGEYVEQLCKKYPWKPHYYFYHGWACMDWFRGYDKTFLIPRAKDRNPTRTFMSPNRIVGGKRYHRVLFLYHVLKQKLDNNHVSIPKVCPQENIDINVVAIKHFNTYPDIEQIFNQAQLPKLFTGEAVQQMTSCWLGNFAEAADSLVYVPTETVYFGRRNHLTEKTFKAIALEMPFVLVSPAGSLEYLREYGFKTFGDIFDESYDQETNDLARLERVVKLLKDLDSLGVQERQQIHRACIPTVEHNYNHFYNGGFASVLWAELGNMLEGLRV